MKQTSIIGIDLAKYNFQLHGAAADGFVLFRKKLTRRKLLDFLASQPRCVVAMEACGGAHYWGRKTLELGHQIRLVPPIYVKPFVKRQKNDATDAEADQRAAWPLGGVRRGRAPGTGLCRPVGVGARISRTPDFRGRFANSAVFYLIRSSTFMRRSTNWRRTCARAHGRTRRRRDS